MIPAPARLILTVVTVIFAATAVEACKDPKMNEQKLPNDDYFKTEKVRYVIDGQRYDVPMGYHWGAYLKYRQWPKPKASYTETTSFEIFALLPDMLPYSAETKDKFDNRKGKADVISVLVQSRSTWRNSLSDIIKDRERTGRLKRAQDTAEAPGLRHFVDTKSKYATKEKWEDIYVFEDIDAEDFRIRCIRSVPFPSCNVQDNADEDGPYLNYSFAVEHLPHWQEIRRNITSLVSSFITQTH